MMKLSCIVFLLNTLSIFAQDSESILKYVESVEGKKVGRGLCFDLVREAAEEVNRNWYKESWCDMSARNESVALEPSPGDIINFIGVVMANGRKYPSHIGIVTKVINDSLIVIAHQNICKTSVKKKTIRYYGSKHKICSNSSVVYETMNLRQKIKGKIIYLRVR